MVNDNSNTESNRRRNNVNNIDDEGNRRENGGNSIVDNNYNKIINNNNEEDNPREFIDDMESENLFLNSWKSFKMIELWLLKIKPILEIKIN